MRDLNGAFPETPASIRSAVSEGIRKGEKAMQKRHKIATAAAIAAACLLLTAAAAFAAVRAGKPQPDPVTLSQPEATPQPLPAELASAEAPALFRDADGTLFHIGADCENAQDPKPVTRDEIDRDDLSACENCVRPFVDFCMAHLPGEDGAVTAEEDEPVYYATENGLYYHLDEHCSGMENAQPYTAAMLDKEGKIMCMICCPGKTEAAPETAADEPEIYTLDGAKYYHKDETCSGMTGAYACPEDEALERGKLPCPVCCGKTGAEPAPTPEEASNAE